jgi:DNA-binding GntR family transcriptional regulator
MNNKRNPLRPLTAKEITDLWDTRCGLETFAVRLAVNFVTASDIRRLRVLVRRRDRAAEINDVKAINQADIAFHTHIVNLSGNAPIQRVFGNIQLLERLFTLADPSVAYEVDVERSPYGHEQIVEALAKRDGDLCEKLLRQHIQAGKRRALKSPPMISRKARTPVRVALPREITHRAGDKR